MKASWGISTLPIFFMRFLPAFCLSSSLHLRLTSLPLHGPALARKVTGASCHSSPRPSSPVLGRPSTTVTQMASSASQAVRPPPHTENHQKKNSDRTKGRDTSHGQPPYVGNQRAPVGYHVAAISQTGDGNCRKTRCDLIEGVAVQAEGQAINLPALYHVPAICQDSDRVFHEAKHSARLQGTRM